jgi:tetratricopeptide (TPR) repeat protein
LARWLTERRRVQPDFYHGWLDLGVAHLYAGDPEAAAAALSRGAALAPGDSDVRFLLGVAEALLGRSAAALAQFQAVERLLGDDRFIAFLPKLAMGYSMLGRVTDVSRLLDELHARGRGIDIGAGPYALAHAAAGERERALEWLRAAVEKVGGGERDPGYYDLVHIMRNLYRQPIFDEPKFTELRRRLAATARAADVP